MADTNTEIKIADRLRELNEGQRGEIYLIDPKDVIVEEGFNPRDFTLAENIASVEELKQEIIEANGVLQAAWVRWIPWGPDKIKRAVLLDGERRLRAVLKANEEGHEFLLPVTQKSTGIGTPAERLALAVTANGTRVLSQGELGKSYLKFIGYGWAVDKIAARFGKSQRYVNDAIALADSPDEVKALVASGDLSTALALKIVKNEGDGAVVAAVKAVKEAKADGKTTAKAEKKDVNKEKLQKIAIILEAFDAAAQSDEVQLTFRDLAGYLAEIDDVVSGQDEVALKSAA